MIRITSFSMVILCLCLVGLANCGPTRIAAVPAGSEKFRYSYGDPRPIGEGCVRYYVAMEYDPRKGVLQIGFLDDNKNRVKLFREDCIRGALTAPQGMVRDLCFRYPWPPVWYFNSYRVVGHRNPPVDQYSLKEDWLKEIPSFVLKIWLPLGDITYMVEFSYP